MAGTSQMPMTGAATGMYGGLTPTGMSMGITPTATPTTALVPILGGPPPTGMSPIAKRPRDLSAFTAMDDGGQQGTRTMTAEDLTGGFLNLSRLQQRDAAYSEEIAKVVHENAVLLNAVVSRINMRDVGRLMASLGHDDWAADVREKFSFPTMRRRPPRRVGHNIQGPASGCC